MAANDGKTVKPLMKRLELMGSKDLSDELYAIAFNIEQTLLNSGAVPKEDYTYLDLIKLAQPFVIEMFKKVDNFEYIYPADKVEAP